MTSFIGCGTQIGMPLFQDAKEKLAKAIEALGGQNAVAKRAGIDQSRLSKFFSGKSGLGFDAACDVLESIGARIVFPDEAADTAKEICFVDAKVLGADNSARPPKAENYFAVPLAEGPVAAGPGLVPEDRVKGWVLIWRYHESLRHISGNLVCVEVGKNEHSMEPTLHPGDIVLVHKDRREIESNRLYLVRDPEGMVKVKRVTLEAKGKITLLVFSSDNPNYKPEPYIVEEDFAGLEDKAIIGKVIWSWSDMSRK